MIFILTKNIIVIKLRGYVAGFNMTKFLFKDDIFYHGTYNEFTRFHPLSHFGSIYAAKKIITSGGPKTEENTEVDGKLKFAEVPKKDIVVPAKIIPVKLNLKNTYELQDMEATHDKDFFIKTLLHHFIYDLQRTKLHKRYDYIVKEPFRNMSWKAVKKELYRDNLYTPHESDDLRGEEYDRRHLFLQRMIYYFESLGFDGFHYVNHYEDPGHVSYMVFRPENIYRQDLELGPQSYTLPIHAKPLRYGGRELTYSETNDLKFETIYRQEDSAERLALWCKKSLAFRPSSFRQYLYEKDYYTKVLYQDILPKVAKIIGADTNSYHDIRHSEQTALFGMDLASSVRQDILPVIIACALHDCARNDDDYCESHGPRCEPVIRKFISENYPTMLPGTVQDIVDAVKFHTVGSKPKNLISACLWDADRIRLSWDFVYMPKYFSTELGRHLAGLAGTERERYIKRQQDFIKKSGLDKFSYINRER